MDLDEPLNPAQQEVVDQLGSAGADRPVFDPGLRGHLRGLLQSGIEPSLHLLADSGDDVLFIGKHQLDQVHGCETKYLADEEEPFVATLPMTIGVVAHKAIELAVNWKGEAVPSELVDRALASLETGESWVTPFLQECSETERAELRSDAVERVSRFAECWPPLKPAWRPVTESRSTVELFDGRVLLRGKVDLSLGRARGNTAGKVLVDLKTGVFRTHHPDELRYYALLETIALGVPPRRLASYYLEQGRFLTEDVTIDLLEATAQRVTDGAVRMLELRADGTDARKRPGPACRWCPVADDCHEGRSYLDERDELDDVDR